MEALRYEFYIDAKPDVVWNILVTEEGTRKIFFGAPMKSTFKVGDSYKFVGPGNDGDETIHVYGKILTFEPNKEISYTEHPGPSYHANHEELETRILFQLETVGACTKLTLINDKWKAGHPSYENSKEHWWMMLSNIKTLAENGKTLDFGW